MARKINLPAMRPRALPQPGSISRLADIAHPNLAALYQLFSEQEQWFFTMEMIHGGNFFDYVKASPAVIRAAPTHTKTASMESRTKPLDEAPAPMPGCPLN
jgi:serine/threonine protein kinase